MGLNRNFIVFAFCGFVTVVHGILNTQPGVRCNSDYDCAAKETLQFCSQGICQCPQLVHGLTYAFGVPLKFSTEWDPLRRKCVSKEGSPCTFKDLWYRTDIVKLDCAPGGICIPQGSGDNSGRQQIPYAYPIDLRSQPNNGQMPPRYHPYSHQQTRQGLVGESGTVSLSDFGLCWNNHQILISGSSNTHGISDRDQQHLQDHGGYQTPFYPVLNPNNNNGNNQPSRHEFATHGSPPYPISPNKLGGGRNDGPRITSSKLCSVLFTLAVIIIIRKPIMYF